MLKILWQGHFGRGLWSEFLHGKYIKGNILEWIRKPVKSTRNSLNLWSGFIKAYMWLGRGLNWNVGLVSNVLIGIDPIIGMEENYQLSFF